MREWLQVKHPIYRAWTVDHARTAPEGTIRAAHEIGPWLRNEIRLRGGDEVLTYLRKFEWEMATGDHFSGRKREAGYLNFPDLFVTSMLGHLMREAPAPDAGLDFGTLGEVRRERDRARPTRAELVYYNTDGVGNDGSQWDNFWKGALRRACATGHRWIMVEAPSTAPQTEQDEIDGLRPYLAEHSPLAVTNWHFERGQLQFAVMNISRRVPRIVSDRLEGNDFEAAKLLLVRTGFDGLGQEYSPGGWWLYDSDGKEIEDAAGSEVKGDWTSTGGEIPLFPLYYERDAGSADLPSMSRPGITELGQMAVAYMNLSSAADWDFFDAAGSIQWLLGVDKDAYNLAMEKIAEGSRFPPLKANRDGTIPQVFDGSTGSVAADVARTVLDRKRKDAHEVALREATSTPDSSGRSKEAGFEEQKAPRLALLASELEQAQNTAIYFLERRFGQGEPRGFVTWPREFDLAPLVEEIRELFEVESLSGYTSPTVAGRALARMAEQKGMVEDKDDFEKIRKEYEESARAGETDRARAAAQDAELEAQLLEGTAAQ